MESTTIMGLLLAAMRTWTQSMPSDRLPVDLELPQLAIAWDPDRMLEVFDNKLTPGNGKQVKIHACRLSRFRYRQGLRSIILYELDVSERGSRHIQCLWVTGSIYKGNKAKRLYKRLKHEALQDPLLTSAISFLPVYYFPKLRMLVQVFPMDRYLPHLPKFLCQPSAEVQQSMLNELFAKEKRTGNIRWRIEPVRYRPCLGATLRYIPEVGAPIGVDRLNQHFYVKLYRDEAVNAYEQMSDLYEMCERSGFRFKLARPIACVKDYQAVIIDRAAGVPLDQLLMTGQNVSEAVVVVADALVEFHLSKLPLMRHRDRESSLTRALKAGAMITWACSHLSDDVSAVLNELENQLTDSLHLPVHLDIKPEHLIIDGGKVTFIDLDSYGCGDPVFDVAMLLVRLRLLPDIEPVSRTTVALAETVLLEQYFKGARLRWRDRLPVNFACAALQVILYYVQRQVPQWPQRVDVLLKAIRTELSC